MLALLTMQAQVTTVSFVGTDRTGQDYVQLEHVSICNQTQLWEEHLFYPDTILRLGTVGIEDHLTSGLQLMQNVPNPFAGTTDFALSLPTEQPVSLEIFDMNGKLIANQQFSSLPAGSHLFRANLTSPQTYLLSANTLQGKTSIKMINTGAGSANSIEYLGSTNHSVQLKNDRGDAHYPFNLNDRMQYAAYALIDGYQRLSDTIVKNQNENDTIVFTFDVERPYVTTLAAGGISSFAATLFGRVTSDNNASVSERGFCYKMGGTPSINDNLVPTGNGTGDFSARISNLEAGKVYSVRAYAKNIVGISYGDVMSFSTRDTLPVVTTTAPSDVAATSFTSGGNVLIANCAGSIARGVCWNTTGSPTIADGTTSNGNGIGVYSSYVTGLNCSTTYYVRAYATNSAGTVYGQEYSVTTLPSTVPEVTTTPVTSIAANTAATGGVIATDGGEPVTARGVCYSTNPNPTLNDAHTSNGTGAGSFLCFLNGLTPGTTYYVRAYATNSVGTAYGDQQVFTTLTQE